MSMLFNDNDNNDDNKFNSIDEPCTNNGVKWYLWIDLYLNSTFH